MGGGADEPVGVAGVEARTQALAHLGEAVIVADVAGTVLSWNPAAERLYGWTAAEAVGRPVFGLVVPPDERTQRQSRPLVAAVAAGQGWSGEVTVRRRDGSTFPAQVSAAAVADTSGQVIGVAGIALDLTGRRASEAALRASEARYRVLVETAPEGIGLVELDGTLRFANPRLAELVGRPVAELVGRNVLSMLPPPGREVARQALNRRRAGLADDWELDCLRPDSGLRHLHVRGAPLRDDAGQVSGSVVMLADDTERRRAQVELTRLALHDPLTGLPNRATLEDRLSQALARGRRYDRGLAVLFCDLDQFKAVNDRLGHAAGDEVLRAVAARLSRAVRPADTVARLGGDEFVVLCEELPDVPEAPEIAEIAEIAERLQAALAPPLTVNGEDVAVTASIGIAVAAPHRGAGPAELLHEADQAMYRAKSSGRAHFEIFGAAGAGAADAGAAHIAALRGGLDRDEFLTVYQPRLDLTTLAPVGAQALARWQHPDRGLLGPATFLAVAERSGLIDELGLHVLGTACREATSWPAGPTGAAPSVSVNLSARQLADPAIVATVARVLADTGLPPPRLILELAEVTLMGHPEDTLRVLADLHTLGVGLSIDRFGTGYFSPTHLRRLPLNELAIDRSLIAGLGSDPDATAVATGVIDLAHALGLRTVALGVETSAQRDVLVALGCDHAEGHLWSRPLQAGPLTSLLGAQA